MTFTNATHALALIVALIPFASACFNGEDVVTSAVCGDGIVHDGAEECDDGGLLNNDGCDSQCEEECVPAQQGVKFDFENVQPGGGLP